MTIRDATSDDIPFLAQIVLLAARSHVEKGVWDFAVPGPEADALSCIEGTLATSVPSWCHYSNFIVAEVEGEPAAALSGYPAHAEDLLPLEQALGRGFRSIGWGAEEVAAAFQRILFFLSCSSDDEPGAWIVEWVATLPEYRRRGLVRDLLLAMLDRGRERDHALAQIGLLMGNTAAQCAYERVGFALHYEKAAAEFEAQVGAPGMARLVMPL